MTRRTRGLSQLALLALFAGSGVAVAQTQLPTGQPAAQPQPTAPIQPRRPIAPGQQAVNPAPAPSPAPAPAAQQPSRPSVPSGQPSTPGGQPASAPGNRAPSVQPGQVPIAQPNPGAGVGGGALPRIQPFTIQGQQAANPFWWGPTFGERVVHTRGPIPGGYTPMGRPAVHPAIEYWPAPGTPRRYQDELSYGPLQPPLPTIPNDDIGPIRPIHDPHPPIPRDLNAVPGGVPRDLVILGGAGVLIRGRVLGDNIRLGFTTGGVPFSFDQRGFSTNLGPGYRYDGFHYYHEGYPTLIRLDGVPYSSCYFAPIAGKLVTIDPQYLDANMMPEQQGVSTSVDETLFPPVERAHLALERGKPKDAIAFYKEHLSLNQQDAPAMRWLSVALLADGQPAAGVAMMIMAYQTEPSLAASPLIASRAGGETELSKRFAAAVGYANSTKGSSAYLTAAVLAQGSGKLDVARKLLEKAKAAGLDRTVLAEFEAALKK